MKDFGVNGKRQDAQHLSEGFFGRNTVPGDELLVFTANKVLSVSVVESGLQSRINAVTGLGVCLAAVYFHPATVVLPLILLV